MALAGGVTDVDGGADRSRLPIRNVPENIAGQRFGNWIAFGPCGHIHLAEQDHPLPFVIFHERAVLEAVAAVDDREEVSARGLLDENGGDVAAIAAAPKPRGLDVAPLDCRSVAGTHRGIEARRGNSSL